MRKAIQQGVIFAVLVVVAPLVCAFSEPVAPFVWDQLSMRDGLSQDTVLDVLQDSQGFVWLATENGINRFDGKRVVSYYRSSTDGLASDYVWSMREGPDGNLYFGSNDAGLMRWTRNTDTFSSVPLQLPAGLDAKAVQRVTALAVTPDGRIWIGSQKHGVLVFERDGRLVEHYRQGGGTPGLVSNDITTLVPSLAGGMWIGTTGGLNHLDPGAGRLTRHRLLPEAEAAGVRVSSVLEASSGLIWVGTDQLGVVVLKPESGVVEHWRAIPGDAAGLTHDEVRDLLEDGQGRIWVATQGGISVHTPGTAGFRQIKHDAADPFSLSNDFVTSLWQDAAGLIWTGTRGGGTSRWNPSSWSLGPRLPAELSGALINTFTDGPDGEIWVGTIGAGLVRLDASGEVTGYVDSAHGFPDLPDARIMALLTDTRGHIWIGTLTAGLLEFDPVAGQMKHFAADPDRMDALAAPGIMSLVELPSGSIAVGTYGGGVALIDGGSGAVERLTIGSETTGHAKIRATALAVGPDDELWVGTEKLGLIRVELATGEIRHFVHDANRPRSLPSDSVYSIKLDESGDVWIGTAGHGLARLRRQALAEENPDFEVWSQASGLAGGVIYGIELDADQQLWLSSNKGLMRFDPASRRVRSYRREHGLFGDEFNFGAHFRSATGRMYFGGTGGFNFFHPEDVVSSRTVPKIAFTAFEKFNEPAQLPVSALVMSEVTLSHADDVITFEYALLDFAAPEKNRYSVRLDGFDRNWSSLSARTRTTYTNLDAGEYAFSVRGMNSDGVWSQVLTAQLVVKPAPWATWWAYLGYATIALLLLFGFLRWNVKLQERKARLNHLAFYDQVTGLPNRDLFEQRAAAALRHAQGSKELSILCVRIEVPKQIIETMGRQGRDGIMQALASSLVRCIHGSELARVQQELARLDSAEFVLLVNGPSSEFKALRLAEQLMPVLKNPIFVGEHRVPILPFIGIASCPAHARDIPSLLKFAAAAASRLSQDQKSGLAVYESSMTEQALGRLDMEWRLRDAIKHGVLTMHFQPKYSSSGPLTGAEALVRWRDDKFGQVPPDIFVKLAEECGVIRELDAWVSNAVCAAMRAWQDQGLPPVHMAVNLSAVNLSDPSIVDMFLAACDQHRIRPQQLEIELTESALAADMDTVHTILGRLKANGFSIALDDFGTGYSSLTYLHDFAIDVVKIDRKFVDGVEAGGSKATICKAIIALAGSLGIKSVAEGVETLAQCQQLKDMGCDELQGYLLGRPMPAEDFGRLIAEQRVAARQVER